MPRLPWGDYESTPEEAREEERANRQSLILYDTHQMIDRLLERVHRMAGRFSDDEDFVITLFAVIEDAVAEERQLWL